MVGIFRSVVILDVFLETRSMTIIEQEFEAVFSKVNANKNPVTMQEYVEYLAVISEAVERCEKLLLYLATNPDRSADMLTYLFEYKQLINLQQTISERKSEARAAEISAKVHPPKKSPWWKFGA